MVLHRAEKTKEQVAWWQRLRISELGIRILCGVIILAVGVLYIVLTTSVATSGLQVKDLSDRLEALNTKRSVLQAEVDRTQSLQRLDRTTADLDLVRVSNVEYLTPSGSVATR